VVRRESSQPSSSASQKAGYGGADGNLTAAAEAHSSKTSSQAHAAEAGAAPACDSSHAAATAGTAPEDGGATASGTDATSTAGEGDASVS
jgi:hypothetical protein